MLHLGRYQLVRKLAIGGMAEVYLAKVAGPGGFEKNVVVKRILPHLADSESFVEMFLSEAKLAAQLDHPNIVHVFDFGEAEGSYFLAMEYVDGQTLRSLVKWSWKERQPPSFSLAARVVSLASEGLEHAHQAQLIHRDVSNENIMIARTGAVKVLDFGIAKVAGDDGQPSALGLEGKLTYMPPEQIRRRNVDHRVDIYALGVVLYQLLSGERPYEEQEDVSLMQAVLRRSPVPLKQRRPDVPEPLLAIVEKAMAKDPAARFASALELNEALETYIIKEGVPVGSSQLAQWVARYSAATRGASPGVAQATGGGSVRAPTPPRSSLDAALDLSGLEGVKPLRPLPSAPHARPSMGGAPRAAPALDLPAAPIELPRRETGEVVVVPEPFLAATGIERTPTAPVLIRLEDLEKLQAQAAAQEVVALVDAVPKQSMQGQGTSPVASVATPPSAKPTPPAPRPSAPPVVEIELTPAPALSPRVEATAGSNEVDSSALTTQPFSTLMAPPPPPVAEPAGAAAASSPPTVPRPQLTALAAPLPAAPAPVLAPPPSVAPPSSLVATPMGPGAALPPTMQASPTPVGRAVTPAGPLPDLGRAAPPLLVPVVTGTPIDAPLAAVPVAPPHASPVGASRKLERRWAPTQIAPEPLQRALRSTASADRSALLLRKLPPVVGRLLDVAKAVPAPLIEAMGALIDTALLAEDHSAIIRLLDRADERPGVDNRFATLVRSELMSPLRLVWLVERLRAGLPLESSELVTWLSRLGPKMVPFLLWAIDDSDVGPPQLLFCDALAPLVAQDPSEVVALLEEGRSKSVAALCYVLERAQAADRQRVFAKLMGRRDEALMLEVVTGRAKAAGADALPLLQSTLGHRNEDVRVPILALIGDIDHPSATAVLMGLINDTAAFEAKSALERAAVWRALAASGSADALTFIEQALLSKLPLLNKKKAIDAKAAVLDGLAQAPTDATRGLLQQFVNDRGQPDDLTARAREVLGAKPPDGEVGRSLRGERRAWLARAVSLDVVMFARAAMTVDPRTGVLDVSLERLASAVRALVAQESRLELTVAQGVLRLNNIAITFGPFGGDVAAMAAHALESKDVRSVLIDAPVPVPMLRSMLLRVFSADGQAEKLSHITVSTVSGRSLTPVSEPPVPAEATARSHELYRAAAGWLFRERESLLNGRPIDITTVGPLLDEWALLHARGVSRTLGRSTHPTTDARWAWHGANTAIVSLAFASDLGLERSSLRELAELALVCELCQAAQVDDASASVGQALSEPARLRAAWLMLSHWAGRRAGAQAVAAVEAGLDAADRSGRGPGLLASIVAMARSFDDLTAMRGQTAAQALAAMGQQTTPKLHPELMALFSAWVQSQADLLP